MKKIAYVPGIGLVIVMFWCLLAEVLDRGQYTTERQKTAFHNFSVSLVTSIGAFCLASIVGTLYHIHRIYF